jgi:hypothetical protein
MNEAEKLNLFNYLSITLSDNSEEKHNLQELLAGTLNDEIKERAFKAFLSKTVDSTQNFEIYRVLLKYKKDMPFSMTEDERRQFEEEILRYLEKNKLIQKTGIIIIFFLFALFFFGCTSAFYFFSFYSIES